MTLSGTSSDRVGNPATPRPSNLQSSQSGVPTASDRFPLEAPLPSNLRMQRPISQSTPAGDIKQEPETVEVPAPTDASEIADLDFLEGYIRSTIWSYDFHGALAFRSNPLSLPHFTPMVVETLAECNSGSHALSDHPCNLDFLAHER